jgi:hypothetical protein
MASRTSSDVLSAKRDRPIKPQKILPAKAHNPVLQHNRGIADTASPAICRWLPVVVHPEGDENG